MHPGCNLAWFHYTEWMDQTSHLHRWPGLACFRERIHELLWASDLTQYLPESLSVHRIKGLCQIYKDHVQVLMLFATFLLYLSNGEDHVHGAAFCTKSTLTLWDDTVAVDVVVKPIQQDTCQYWDTVYTSSNVWQQRKLLYYHGLNI